MAPLSGGTTTSTGTAGSGASTTGPISSVIRIVADAQAPVSQLRNVAGTLALFSLFNNAPSARWVRFYDTATLPDATSAPVWIGPFMLSASDTYTSNLPTGLSFSNGLAIALSAGPGDNDLTPILDGDITGFVGVR